MEVKVHHVLENSLGVFGVSLFIWGEDENVIHVENQPPFCNHITKGIIHKTLEGSGGIAQAKGHYGGFKETSMSNKGSFPLMFIFNTDIIVSPSDIKLGEYLSALKLVNKV